MNKAEESTLVHTEQALEDAITHQTACSEEVLGSEAIPNFHYRGLKSEKREIRLVRILPRPLTGSGDTDPDISCEIIDATLDGGPEYMALSYAWGDVHSTRRIMLNGSLFHVTESLYVALLHLQDETESSIIWIDAISINQADDVEKSHQVQLMRDIYKAATRVIIWLGPSSEGTDTAMDMLSLIGDHALRLGIWDLKEADLNDWNNIENDGSQISQTKLNLLDFMGKFADKVRDGMDPFAWLNKANLGDRSWFWRAWVMQESAVSREAMFVCGEKIIEYTIFWAAWFFFGLWRNWLIGKYDVHLEAGESYSPAVMSILRQHHLKTPTKGLATKRKYLTDPENASLSLKSLLCRANVFNSTGIRIDAMDPRDRAYAFLGIANDILPDEILPDYTKSYTEVYTEVARCLLKHGHLDILALCRARSLEESLPSWVPDWTAMNRTPWFEYQEDAHFDASGSTSPEIFDADRDRSSTPLISLSGDRISTIQLLGPIWSVGIHCDFPYSTAGTILDSISHYLALSTRYTPTQKDEATYRLPIGDLSGRGVVNLRSRALPDDKHGYDLMRAAVLDPATREAYRGEHHKRYIAYMGGMERMHDSRPFLSPDGYVGLCPMSAQEGDVVFVFRGAPVPFVLRDNGDGTFELVGEAHVFRVMDGEVSVGNTVAEKVVLR